MWYTAAMSVTLYNKTYYEGEQMTIDNGQRDLNGTAFDDNIQSLKVADGTKVTIGRNYGLSGGKLVLYPGDYPNAMFQQDKMYSYNSPNKGSSIKVEKAEGFTREHQVRVFGIINWAYPNEYFFNVPIGDWTAADGLFPNDNLWKIQVPDGVKVTLYQNGDKSGASCSFDRAGQYNLKDYGLLYSVSAITVELIDYEDVGTSFDDPIKLSEEVVATSRKTIRNEGSVEQETSVSIEKDMATATSVAWEHGGSISLTSGLEIKVGGEASAVSATFKVESTTTYSFNETKSKEVTATRSYTAEQSVKIPPKSSTTATLVVKQGSYKIPFKQHFKNKITGEIITRGGVLYTDNGFESFVNYDKIEDI